MRFYGKIRTDAELGPIFNRAIADWDPHLEKMCAFWSSVMRMSGRYHGNPMATHLRLKTVRPEHFQRWLALFGETARELCPPEYRRAIRSQGRNHRPQPADGHVLPPGAAAAIPNTIPG